MERLIQVGLEDVAQCFGMKKNLFQKYFKNEIMKNENLLNLMKARENMGDWQNFTPLGGPGTALNGIVLYCIVRYYSIRNVLETGVSGGFYSAFLLEALKANRQEGAVLISLELSESCEVGKLVPEPWYSEGHALAALPVWRLFKGQDSVKVLKEAKQLEYYSPSDKRSLGAWCSLFCHDSLHTMSHMMKELSEFKRRIRGSDQFIYIDDQNSDEFWRKCVQNGAFKKPGFSVKYISGNESRLGGHLGGFIKYIKVIDD